MFNNSAISQQLLKLANPQLTEYQQQLLLGVIQRLFTDLAAGHSCSLANEICQKLAIDINQLQQILQLSDLSACYVGKPNKLELKPFSYIKLTSGDVIYISKYLAYELNIAKHIQHLIDKPTLNNSQQINQSLNKLEQLSEHGNKPNREQFNAIKLSCQQTFSIISGGPGTGKTTTVTLLLWTLYQAYGLDLKVKICAPTGKAAVRVRESIENSINGLADAQNFGITTECFTSLLDNSSSFGTLHKLLGYIPHKIHFKHNATNHLDCDVLIIDESSMIGLPLFSKLLQAVNPLKIRHIIFLGDYNQLSSVEEGYVFASLVNFGKKNNETQQHDLFSLAKPPILSELIVSNRNQGEIFALAQAILHKNLSKFTDLIHNGTQIKLFMPQLSKVLNYLIQMPYSNLMSYLNFMIKVDFNNLDIKLLFQKFTSQTLLCLTNRGVLGVDNLNSQLERQIKQKMEYHQEWYNGRPIIILQNDYSLDLFNGDIGICICNDDVINIIFENGRRFIPEILPKYALAYAITIHKSQGSEYDQVNLILPDINYTDANDSINRDGFLSRELVYTAITRARKNVNIFAEFKTLEQAIQNNVQRNSGLIEFIG